MLGFNFLSEWPMNTRLIVFATFFAGLGAGISEVNFNYYLLSLGYKELFIASMTAAGTLTGAIVSVPFGLIIDRIGRRAGIIIAQLLAYPLLLIQLFLPLSPVLLACIVVANMAGTIHGLSEGPLLVETTDQAKRVNVLSMVTMTSLVAVIIGNFVGGKLTYLASVIFSLEQESVWAYRSALLCTFMFSTIAVSFYLRLRPVPKPEIKEFKGSGNLFKRLFGNIESFQFIWKLLLGQTLIGFGAGFTVPLFSLFFRKVYGATADQWGTISSIAKFPMLFGVYISPKVARRYGNLRTVIACQYMSIPFLLITLFAPNIFVAGAMFAVRNALMNMTGPIWSSFYMGVLKPKELSTTSSFLTVFWNMMNSTGTRIGGQLLENDKYYWSFMVTAATYLTASTFYLLTFRKYEPLKLSRFSKNQAQQ